jgi:hypothetical protein
MRIPGGAGLHPPGRFAIGPAVVRATVRSIQTVLDPRDRAAGVACGRLTPACIFGQAPSDPRLRLPKGGSDYKSASGMQSRPAGLLSRLDSLRHLGDPQEHQ